MIALSLHVRSQDSKRSKTYIESLEFGHFSGVELMSTVHQLPSKKLYKATHTDSLLWFIEDDSRE